jgi:hypothetical protein
MRVPDERNSAREGIDRLQPIPNALPNGEIAADRYRELGHEKGKVLLPKIGPRIAPRPAAAGPPEAAQGSKGVRNKPK